MTQFKPIVWQLLIGMVFSRTASFMTLPFLAIYMQQQLQASPLLIGLAVGIAPLASTIGGFFGGFFTDVFGRKKIVLLAMGGWILAFYGFAFANSASLFILLNALNGLSRAFFEPASQAFMIDHTPSDKRRRLFSIRYTLINLSAVVGPLIGVWIAHMQSMTVPYIITGTLYVGCFVFFWLVLRRVEEVHATKDALPFRALVHVLIKDRTLLFIIAGSACASFMFAQTDSTLSQLLSMTMADGLTLFSILVATNALTVLILQLPISSLTEKLSVKRSLLFGSVLMVLSMALFALAQGWLLYIVAMVIMSLGEIFIFPMMGVIIEMIAPESQKATYIGVLQFQSIGGFIGPIFGGWMLVHFAGHLYTTMILVALIMLVCYERSFSQQRTARELSQV